MTRRSRIAGASLAVAVVVALLSLLTVARSLGGGAESTIVLAAGPGGSAVQVFPISADYCYIEVMIPHHEQALVLSEIILDKSSTGDRVRALAEFIVTDQSREIETMVAWQDAWATAVGRPPNPWARPRTAAMPRMEPRPWPSRKRSRPASAARRTATTGDMPSCSGMASDAQLDALRSSDRVAAERMFLELMIAHHEGALEMARTAITEGENAFTRASAKHVLREQTREVGAMLNIIEALG